MLTLTGQAVDAIKTLTSEPGLPADTGLRIASQGDDTSSLAVSLADGPQPGDEVVESEGVRVFVGSGAAPMLADKALDAQVSEQGRVSFMLGSAA